MALFGKKAAGDSTGWTPVGIHIVTAKRPNPHPDGFSSTTFDAVVDLVRDSGGTPYEFVLEVRPPGGEPYRVEHQEKVPQKVTAPGMSMEEKIPNGIDVSGWVRVDDPMTVAIDWTSYKSSPEAKAAVAEARQVEVDEVYVRGVLSKQKPKMQEQLRASAWASVSSLAAAVASGDFSREEWEESALLNLRRTLITPEQYSQAVAIAEG